MLEQALKKHFNHSSFRPGQKEIIETVMAGQDVVALMPTGGGKSLCYQLPSLLSDKASLVISPLIALMKDQVDSLNARGIAAAFINSSLAFEKIQQIMADARSGKIKLLYIAPERLANQQFRKFLGEIDVNFLAIDEAHCVSEWGHDFRPDYMAIKDCLQEFKKRPTVAAFTATATPEVKDDIIKNLELKNPQIFIRGFDRPNLKFFAQNNLKKRQRKEEILRIIKTLPGSGIVYAISRKSTEEIAGYLSEKGIAAMAYHAGLGKEQRTRVQNDFMENRFKVIVATIAFGLGVDKADIRFVVHAGLPSSLEGYYQEAGRAGRDGETAYCILLHSQSDFGLHYYFIQKSRAEMMAQGKSRGEIERIIDIKYKRLEKMNNYANLNSCRRKFILNYFNDPAGNKSQLSCGGCDVCLNFKWTNAVPLGSERSARKERNETTDTVRETVKLYQNNYSLEQIAKIRSLGVSTIFTHLIKWYLDGGELAIEKLITREEESLILSAMSRAEDYRRLSSIKTELPVKVSYEKIRLVLAKIQKMELF